MSGEDPLVPRESNPVPDARARQGESTPFGAGSNLEHDQAPSSQQDLGPSEGLPLSASLSLSGPTPWPTRRRKLGRRNEESMPTDLCRHLLCDTTVHLRRWVAVDSFVEVRYTA